MAEHRAPRADSRSAATEYTDSYYGRPILKEPAWKVPDVPLYLFLGGMAGASASIAELAALTGRPGLARVGRLAAAGGAQASVVALVHDLGRPERFLHMLRVFKPTSPLSVGSWILAPFSALASASAIAELTGPLPRLGALGRAVPALGRVASVGAALVGPAMCTYTAVLLADTAIPAWHSGYRHLPFLFAGSAVTSAAGVALIAAPGVEQAPARRLAVLGTGAELVAGYGLENDLGLVGEPYRSGRAGSLITAGRVLTGVGAGLAVAGRPRFGRVGRALAAAGGAAMLAGGLCTRFGVFLAGVASARDPRYVVAPQRERLAQRGSAAARNTGRPGS